MTPARRRNPARGIFGATDPATGAVRWHTAAACFLRKAIGMGRPL
jgi:hypothetical protein